MIEKSIIAAARRLTSHGLQTLHQQETLRTIIKIHPDPGGVK